LLQILDHLYRDDRVSAGVLIRELVNILKLGFRICSATARFISGCDLVGTDIDPDHATGLADGSRKVWKQRAASASDLQDSFPWLDSRGGQNREATAVKIRRLR
jgi:hypothetical protein